MGKSWGHVLIRIPEDMKAGQRRQNEHRRANFPDLKWDDRQCRMPKCTEESEFVLEYSYVTGRAGRVSSAQKCVCEKHAQKYIDAGVVPVIPDPKWRKSMGLPSFEEISDALEKDADKEMYGDAAETHEHLGLENIGSK